MKQLHLPGMEPKQKISNEPKSAYVEKQKAKQKPTDPIVNHVIKTMVQYDDVPAEDYAVKYNPTTGLFSNKERDIAFKNYNDLNKRVNKDHDQHHSTPNLFHCVDHLPFP